MDPETGFRVDESNVLLDVDNARKGRYSVALVTIQSEAVVKSACEAFAMAGYEVSATASPAGNCRIEIRWERKND